MKFKSAFKMSSNGFIRAAVALVLGVLLIIWPDSAVNTIVIVIGASLIASGISSLVLAFKTQKEDAKANMMYVNSIINFIFGLLLVLMPSFFISIIMFLFGAILLFFGIGQLISLSRVRQFSPLPWFFYIAPVAVLICGVVIFFNPFKTMTALFVFFGFVLVFYAVSEIISTIRIRVVLKNEEKLITDVDFEEVNDDEKEK